MQFVHESRVLCTLLGGSGQRASQVSKPASLPLLLRPVTDWPRGAMAIPPVPAPSRQRPSWEPVLRSAASEVALAI
jgi:hypothetical protein